MNRLAKWIIGIAAVCCALFACVTQLILPGIMEGLIPYVEKTAAGYINGTVTIGSISKLEGLTFLIKDITVKDQKQQLAASVPETRISVNPVKGMVSLEKAVSAVELKKPTVYIRQDADETWNFKTLLKPSESDTTPFYGKVTVDRGTAVVQLPEGKWEYAVDGFVDGSYNPAFDLNFTVDAPGMETARVIGSVDNKGTGKIVMKSARVDLAPYYALALRYGQVKDAAGQVADIDGEWSNDGKRTMLRGACNLQEVRGSYRMDGKEIPFRVTGQVSSSGQAVSAKELLVSVDGQEAVISGTVDIRDPDAPEGHVSLRADKVSHAGETVSDVEAEALLAGRKAVLNLVHAAYRGGTVTGQGVYEFASGNVTGEAAVRKITLDGEAVNGEAFVLNAALAGSGNYNREDGRFRMDVAANTMDLQWRDMVLNVMDFDAELSNDGAEIRAFSAFAGNGALQAAGKVGSDGSYDIRGRMADMPLEPVMAAAGQQGGGLVSSSYHLYGQGSHVSFEGPVQLRQAVWKDFFLTEGQGNVTIHDNVVELDGYRLSMDRGTHVADGTIDLRGEEPRFDLAVDTENVRIEPLVTAAGFRDSVSVTGNLSNHMLLTGTLSEPAVKGTVNMSDGSVEGHLIDSVTGGYLYHKGSLYLQDIVVKALSATLKLHGQMDENRHLDFEADAANVDLSRLPIRDEDVKLGGLASAVGHLGGTLDKPLFSGDVTSEEFVMNGVPVKNLQGTLVTNGSDINSLRGTCEQENTDGLNSAYMIDLTLNIPERDLRGRMGIMYGDLQNIMKMARVEFPVKGLAAGTLEFNGRGQDTVADFWGYKLDINGVKYDQLALKARLNKGLLTIDNAKLQEDMAFFQEGTISANGTVNLRDRNIQLNAQAVNANPAILTAFMKNPAKLTGTMNMTVHMEGTIDAPKGRGTLEISGGSFADVNFDLGKAEVVLAEDILTIKDFSAEKDMYKLAAHGKLPVDLFREKGKRRNPDAQMDITADFNQASLAVLGALPSVEWGVGDTRGELKLSGTLEDPRMFGNLSVAEGCLKLKDIYTLIDKVNLEVVFNGTQVRVENASAVLGKGTAEGSGTFDLKAGDENAYRFTGVFKNAEADSAIVKGRVNGTFAVTPEYYRVPKRLLQQAGDEDPAVTGMAEGWRPKITADIRLDDVLVNMPTIPSMSDETSNLGMDIAVTLGPKVHLYNKYLYDLWLKGAIHAKGSTVFPRIEGSVETDKGTVTYLRTRFKVDKGSARWSEPGTFLPYVKLAANTKFSRYRIALQIDGPLSKGNLDLSLKSNPSLPRNTLVRMLTLQRTTAGSDDITNEDMQNLLIAGLETGLLGDVEQTIRKALGIDEFRLYVGKVENGVDFDNRIVRELSKEEKDQYNFLIAKNLTERWKIGYTRSFNGRYDNVYTQYQLTDHMNFTLSQDENHDRRYSIEYRISF